MQQILLTIAVQALGAAVVALVSALVNRLTDRIVSPATAAS